MVLLVAAAAGCAGGPSGPSIPVVASVVVSPAGDTLVALGQTRQLTAIAKDASGTPISGKTFAWSTSASTIVGVDPASGLATAQGNGQATLTASVDGKSGQAVILVDQQVNTVEISPGTAGATALGATQQFTATAKDASGAAISGVKFLWVSSDPTVATVDSTGKVTARGPGVATITVAARGFPAHAVFTVTQTATQLAVTSFAAAGTEGLPLSSAVQVEIRDANGTLVAGARNLVQVALAANANGATVSGATAMTAVGGVATFTDLTIDRAGQGYTLVASAAGLAPSTTGAFNISLNFVSVSATNFQTCGVTASGDGYCWGRNLFGNLGDGTTTNRSLPTRVTAPAGIRFTWIHAGGGNSPCGTTTTQTTYCWGFGLGGEIGDGVVANRSVPELVTPPAGVNLTSVWTGGHHACGPASNGSGYCWGGNATHQIGDGTVTSRLVPTQVAAPAGVSFVAMSAGGFTSCGLTGLGTAYCWGDNAGGAIGDGTTTERNTPTLVAAPGGVTFVSVGTSTGHSCGLTPAGTAYCWGTNDHGEVGDGTISTRLLSVPVTMPAGVTFVQLSVGATHNCAISQAGFAYCWGLGSSGQIGNGGFTDVLAPSQINMPAGVVFAWIAADVSHTCAVTSQGAPYCWGLNSSGQLGDGTLTTRSSPVRVAR